MEVSIRRAHATDWEVLYVMVCELENTRLDRERFREIIEKNTLDHRISYFIAMHGSEPVGTASCHVQLLLHHAAPVAEIQELFVLTAYRSQGIGRQLCDVLRTFARQQGAILLEVTSRHWRLDTHRFYEREGFINTHYKLTMPL